MLVVGVDVVIVVFSSTLSIIFTIFSLFCCKPLYFKEDIKYRYKYYFTKIIITNRKKYQNNKINYKIEFKYKIKKK